MAVPRATERERERGRQSERERERERGRQGQRIVRWCWCGGCKRGKQVDRGVEILLDKKQTCMLSNMTFYYSRKFTHTRGRDKGLCIAMS